MATNKDMSTTILAAVSKNPGSVPWPQHQSEKKIVWFLHEAKWHLYKLQMLKRLNEDDSNGRSEFCQWILSRIEENPDFATSILLTRCTFMRGQYAELATVKWRQFQLVKVREDNIMVWCEMAGLLVHFLSKVSWLPRSTRSLLEKCVLPSLLNEDSDFPTMFQQDSAPLHYRVIVHQWQDNQFLGRWISQRGLLGGLRDAWSIGLFH